MQHWRPRNVWLARVSCRFALIRRREFHISMQPNARIRNSLLKHVNSWWYHALNMVWWDSMPWAWTTHEQIHHDQSANVSPYQKCFYLHVIALCVGHSELLYISVRNDCHNRTHQQIIIPIKWIWNDFDSFFFSFESNQVATEMKNGIQCSIVRVRWSILPGRSADDIRPWWGKFFK